MIRPPRFELRRNERAHRRIDLDRHVVHQKAGPLWNVDRHPGRCRRLVGRPHLHNRCRLGRRGNRGGNDNPRNRGDLVGVGAGVVAAVTPVTAVAPRAPVTAGAAIPIAVTGPAPTAVAAGAPVTAEGVAPAAVTAIAAGAAEGVAPAAVTARAAVAAVEPRRRGAAGGHYGGQNKTVHVLYLRCVLKPQYRSRRQPVGKPPRWNKR